MTLKRHSFFVQYMWQFPNCNHGVSNIIHFKSWHLYPSRQNRTVHLCQGTFPNAFWKASGLSNDYFRPDYTTIVNMKSLSPRLEHLLLIKTLCIISPPWRGYTNLPKVPSFLWRDPSAPGWRRTLFNLFKSQKAHYFNHFTFSHGPRNQRWLNSLLLTDSRKLNTPCD